MAERGGFSGVDPEEVAKVVFVGLKAELKTVETDLQPGDVGTVWDEFVRLMTDYARPQQGYTARRALMKDDDETDYDHLSRYGEWDQTAAPKPEDMA